MSMLRCDLLAVVFTLGAVSGCGGSGAGDAEGSGGSAPSGGQSSGSGGTSTGGASTGGTPASGGSATGGAGTGGAGTGGSGAVGGTCDPTGSATASGTPGVWENVTPAELDVTSTANGAEIVLVDPARPQDVYVGANQRGLWKSTDFGVTFSKVNTGTNGDQIDGGGFPYGAIELDTCRDPDTPPIIYVTQLFGASDLWKSIDGGVSWENVWRDRIFAPDGTTNISSDVGGDLHSVHFVDENDSERLIASLHGYGGSGDNNGVFETTNGGQSWIVHKAETFTFQPHNSLLFPVSPDVWLVTPGTVSSVLDIFRTADGAETWTNLGEAPGRSIGRFFIRAGSVLYSGADYGGGVRKSTDEGLSWSQLPDSGGQVSWVLASDTTLYASTGYTGNPEILSAPLDDDTNWSVHDEAGSLPELGQNSNLNGHNAGITFDGEHYVIIAAQHNAGILRYVEP